MGFLDVGIALKYRFETGECEHAKVGFRLNEWLEKSSVHHNREVCRFAGKSSYEMIIKNNEVKQNVKKETCIVHNKINIMHLHNKYGEFSFHATLMWPDH